MKSFWVYICVILSFLPSFCFSSGFLNDNAYIKQFAVGFVFSIQGVIFLLSNRSWKTEEFRFSWIDILVILLFLVYLYFFKGTKNYLDLTIPFIYFFYYFFLRIYLKNDLHLITKALFQIVPFVICGHYVIIILQYLKILPNLHSFFSIGSTFGNPDMFGSYLTILLSISIGKKNKKIIDHLILITGIIALIMLQARTSLMAIVIILIYIMVLKSQVPRKILWICAGFIVIFFILLVLWHPQSVSGRLFIWIVAIRMFINNLQGYGLYVFQKDFLEQQLDFIEQYPKFSALFNVDQAYSPFNEFINVGVSFGIIGLILYSFLILNLLILSHRNKSPYIYPLISYLIISLSYFPFKIAPINIIMIVIIGIMITSISLKTVLTIKTVKHVVVILLISASIGINSFNYNTFKSWKKATDKSLLVTSPVQEREFLKIYPYLKENGLFLFSYANYNYVKGNLNKAKELIEKANNYHMNVELLNFSATLYEQSGEIGKAESHFRKAVALSNGNYNASFDFILFLVRTGKQKEAYELAIELYNRPIGQLYYIDAKMIRIRLEEFIEYYEDQYTN